MFALRIQPNQIRARKNPYVTEKIESNLVGMAHTMSADNSRSRTQLSIPLTSRVCEEKITSKSVVLPMISNYNSTSRFRFVSAFFWEIVYQSPFCDESLH